MNDSIGYGVPELYQYVNAANALVTPSTVHVRSTGLAWFFRRYLLQRAMSVFKFKIPETWAKNYFLYVLFCWGYGAVVNTDKYGVIFQASGLRGFDLYYQPTNAVITNPLLSGILEPRIGLQCEIIKLQPDYGGIMDIVSFYADMMALSAETAGTNLLNSKLAYVFGAGSKNEAETLKKLFDRIASGEPAAFYDKDMLDEDGNLKIELFNQNLKQTYIAGDILEDMRKWEQKFDTEVGIPNANTEKKERLLTDEVNSNNIEVQTKAALWLETLQECFDKVNAMFDLDLQVEMRFKEELTAPVNEGGDNE